MSRPAAVLCLAALLVALPAVSAHTGIGEAVETRFAPPTWLVWAAGAAAVAVSFAVVGGYLSTARHIEGAYGRPRTAPGDAQAAPTSWGVGRLVGLALLALIVLNAFLPTSDSLLPAVGVWLLVWALLPLVAYTVGDVWPRVSPFVPLGRLADTARGARDPLPWPRGLDAWPATVLLLALVGLEVAAPAWAGRAGTLAWAVLLYVFLTVVGMGLFGAARWQMEAEVFTRYLRWWGAASPVRWQGGRPHWRGFSAPLAALPVLRVSDVAFTIGVLYGVNFDGFVSTALGVRMAAGLATAGVPAPLAVLLVGGWLLFLLVWLAAARSIRKAAHALTPLPQVAAGFAAALLPIAVGYHLAHNLFYLVESSPRILVALLDPLGFAGWPEVWVHPPLRLSWPAAWLPVVAFLQVGLVLVGHVVAVVVAHHLAFASFPSRVQAVKGEVPLTLVMVLYTWIGLWVLSGAHGGTA